MCSYISAPGFAISSSSTTVLNSTSLHSRQTSFYRSQLSAPPVSVKVATARVASNASDLALPQAGYHYPPESQSSILRLCSCGSAVRLLRGFLVFYIPGTQDCARDAYAPIGGRHGISPVPSIIRL
ncbi:hypothetical protein FVE85_4697 [Porphyridium purpureum]|uniref:Uncharacterized protein n=1 Tax=Porphyridium purpureum TaxID=35688 RepID=A0A5J4YRQ0_PORPP|nr:hypothetical protein FVE85_4697 [Porphyridium purpureum]|eukprot:POR2606..scf236_6